MPTKIRIIDDAERAELSQVFRRTALSYMPKVEIQAYLKEVKPLRPLAGIPQRPQPPAAALTHGINRALPPPIS